MVRGDFADGNFYHVDQSISIVYCLPDVNAVLFNFCFNGSMVNNGIHAHYVYHDAGESLAIEQYWV